MAIPRKDVQYSKYQKGVIKSFYDNNETIKIQKLSEMVTNMYLETSEKKLENAWKKVEKFLQDLQVSKYHIETIMNERSLEKLSKKIGTLF